MEKDSIIKVKGVIEEVLPNTKFKVRLENGNVISAYISGKIRKYRIRILEGDTVQVELSAYDTTNGRIVYKERN